MIFQPSNRWCLWCEVHSSWIGLELTRLIWFQPGRMSHGTAKGDQSPLIPTVPWGQINWNCGLSSAFTTHWRMLAWDILGQLAWDVKGFKSSSSTWHAPCCQNNSDGDDLCNYVILHDATFEHWHCIEEADFHRPPVDVWGQRWAEDSRCFRQKHPPRASTPLP